MLTRHGDIDATNIQVRVENGEVTLEGTVNSRREKRMAEDAVEDLHGVREVHNRLRVETREGEHRGGFLGWLTGENKDKDSDRRIVAAGVRLLGQLLDGLDRITGSTGSTGSMGATRLDRLHGLDRIRHLGATVGSTPGTSQAAGGTGTAGSSSTGTGSPLGTGSSITAGRTDPPSGSPGSSR